MQYEDNPRSIKYYVKRLLQSRQDEFAGKKVLDLPAGNGLSSRWLRDMGAEVLAMDLFPQYFRQPDITCQQADIADGIPLGDQHLDWVLSQEGIEHFSDQFAALQEFNRVLKPGGKLLLTTPNYSNLSARYSYLLAESERHSAMMPPNEIDSIWLNHESGKTYFGHVFLLGIQRLRTLASVAGFRLVKVHPTRVKSSSLWLLFLWPLIWLSNYFAYAKSLRSASSGNTEQKKRIYAEQLRLATDWIVLTHSHLFLEFEKIAAEKEHRKSLPGLQTEFGIT